MITPKVREKILSAAALLPRTNAEHTLTDLMIDLDNTARGTNGASDVDQKAAKHVLQHIRKAQVSMLNSILDAYKD